MPEGDRTAALAKEIQHLKDCLADAYDPLRSLGIANFPDAT